MSGRLSTRVRISSLVITTSPQRTEWSRGKRTILSIPCICILFIKHIQRRRPHQMVSHFITSQLQSVLISADIGKRAGCTCMSITISFTSLNIITYHSIILYIIIVFGKKLTEAGGGFLFHLVQFLLRHITVFTIFCGGGCVLDIDEFRIFLSNCIEPDSLWNIVNLIRLHRYNINPAGAICFSLPPAAPLFPLIAQTAHQWHDALPDNGYFQYHYLFPVFNTHYPVFIVIDTLDSFSFIAEDISVHFLLLIPHRLFFNSINSFYWPIYYISLYYIMYHYVVNRFLRNFHK